MENLIFTKDDNSSLYETYLLEYELFLIEESTFRTLNNIDRCSLQEAYINESEILFESIKETLSLWVTRFVEAVQNALNKFMAAIEGAKDLTYLKSIESRVKALNEDPGFTVNNIRNYHDDAIRNFKVLDFQEIYNTNKDSLQNQEQFLITNYSNYGFANGNTDIKDVLEKNMVEIIPNSEPMTVALIQGYYNWCRNDYLNDIRPINEQMNKYNTSVKSISNLINSLPDDFRNPQQTANNPNVTQSGSSNTQSVNSSYIFTGLSVIKEDDTTSSISGTQSVVNNNQVNNQQNNTSNNNKNNKMSFEDKVDRVGKAGGENQEVINAVKTYLSCTTRLLSNVFIIIKNRKADYMRILKHLFPVGRDMRNVNNQNNGTEMTFTNRVPSVDTSSMNGINNNPT